MKIALTGASSVGKTFLSDHLMENAEFRKYITKFITPDARSILDNMGYNSTDLMEREQLRYFQLEYFNKKECLEKNENNFLTDRSFVDVEAFWEVRDTFDMPKELQDKIKLQCKKYASSYDLNFYLPFGIIPFESDGYRSEDIKFHQQIDSKIRTLLDEWNINYIALDMFDIQMRVDKVILETKKYIEFTLNSVSKVSLGRHKHQ